MELRWPSDPAGGPAVSCGDEVWQPMATMPLAASIRRLKPERNRMPYNKPKGRNSRNSSCANLRLKLPSAELLLPGALLMTVLAELLPPLMLVNLRFSTFFQ